jgi:outer membrane protein TolC
MKKIIAFCAAAAIASAASITTLLQAVKKIPDTKIDFANVKEMRANKKEVVSSLYPKITLLANAVHYSNPYNLRPMPPTESVIIAKEGGGYWFSKNIQRLGFQAQMPLFIKSIFDNKKKMQYLLNAVKYKAKLNLLQREAMLITYVSNLNYLYELKKALIQKRNSIKQTRDAIAVGVKVGRIPEFKLLRLDDALNQIKIKLKEISMNMAKTESDIYKLTMMKIKAPVNITTVEDIKSGEFYAVKPLKEQLKASEYSIKAAKDSFWPKIVIKIEGMRNFGKAYDNGKQLALNFASAGIYLSWDIYDKKSNAQVQKAKIASFKDSLLIKKTVKDLRASVYQIKADLKDIEKSIKLTQKSIKLKVELLKSAKKAFELNTMTVDEYLQYEDDLAMAKANLASLIAKKDALLANLAFIYGDNFERIFK